MDITAVKGGLELEQTGRGCEAWARVGAAVKGNLSVGKKGLGSEAWAWVGITAVKGDEFNVA